MTERHDLGYRLLFSNPRLVRDLLRGYIRQPWVQELDFSTLQKLSEVYVSDQLDRREEDLVWRLRWGKGWLYVYLLFEFQSTVDRHMALRMAAYLSLFYQDLLRRGEHPPEQALPPVLPVVIYNGDVAWWAKRELAELIGTLPPELAAYRLQLGYLLIDEQRAAAPPEADNLAAVLFDLESCRTAVQIDNVIARLARIIARAEQPGELRRAFSSFLSESLLPARFPDARPAALQDLQEDTPMLRQTVQRLTQEARDQGLAAGIQEGIEKGIEKGVQKGLREGLQKGRREGLREGERQGQIRLLRRQLEHRFGPLDAALQERIAAASSRQLERWGQRFAVATSLADVFRR